VKRWPVIFVAALVVIVGLAYFLSRPPKDRTIPSTPPKGAPAVGSCWTVEPAVAQQAMPWPGNPVDCGAKHTAEVFFVAQASPDLLHRLDRAKADNEKKVATSLLYAQARRACVVDATTFLRGGWHSARVQVLASWIKPSENGFFACSLAETDGPAASHFVSRTGTLKASLKDGEKAPLAIACVAQSTGSSLSFSPCTGPHDGEFVGEYTITPPDAPFDDAAVKSASQRGCGEVAAKYLGISGSDSRTDLRAGAVGPSSADDWLGSDQTYSCYVMANNGKITATVKGLGLKPLPQ
jgi:hypothetical protein